MSLRGRLAIVVLVVAAVASLTAGALNHRATNDRLLAEIDRSLTETLVGLPRDGRGRMQMPMVRAPLATYDVQVLDEDGRVMRTTAEVPLPVSPEIAEILGRTDRRALATVHAADGAHRVLSVGTQTGAYQVSRSLAEVDRVLSALRVRTVVVALWVAVVAAVIAHVLVGRATIPLRRVTGAADEIARTGALDTPADLERMATGGDEAARLAASFATMLAALRRSEDEQRRLVDDAGHELRTPLTSIRTNLELLDRYGALPEAERTEILADLRTETDELVGLVDGLITVARGSGDEEPFVELGLADLAEPLARRTERRWGIEVSVSADGSRVQGQPAALRRAISNLLDNAAKFSTAVPHRSSAPIELVIRQGGVEVRDRGPGIADEDLPKVFDRFHRSPTARSMPGSGLGLAIVAEVVARHGGTVHAANRPGGGAVVGFELPLVLSPDS